MGVEVEDLEVPARMRAIEVGVVEAIQLQIRDKAALPDTFGITADGVPAKFTDQHWRGSAQLQVPPVRIPETCEVHREVRRLKPALI